MRKSADEHKQKAAEIVAEARTENSKDYHPRVLGIFALGMHPRTYAHSVEAERYFSGN